MVPFFITRFAFSPPLYPLLGGSRASGTVPEGLFQGITLSRQDLFQHKIRNAFQPGHAIIRLHNVAVQAD